MAQRTRDDALTNICLKLKHEISSHKLKQLKFLLKDPLKIDVLKDKDFLEVITELEKRKILQRSCLRHDGLLLCELFDAIARNDLADTICENLRIERDPNYKSSITPYRKLLVKLSEVLDQNPYPQKMLEFLERMKNTEPKAKTLHVCVLDSSLEILEKMEHADLISSDNLSFLKEMLRSFNREDLVKVIEEFIRKAPFGLRNLPSDMISREPEMNAVLHLLNSGKNKVGVVGVRSRDVVGIRGMGGIGKTVLAQAVAWNMSSSRDVIWLDIGQTPDHLGLVNTLVKALGGSRSFSDLPTAQAWIRDNTVNKDTLVVLDDVWSVDDAYVFDYLEGKCQLLVTTRDADVVRGLKGSEIHELGTMKKDEARRLLYQSAQVESTDQFTFGENVQQIVEGLLEECRGLPLALALVGSSLVETRDEQDWQDVLDDLHNADLESLRSLFPKDAYPYDNLLAAIGVSFQRLERHHQEKFLDFAIFPEDTDVPSEILEMFWSSDVSRGSPCTARQARGVLNVLERRSLIQKGPPHKGMKSYRIHDLLLDFARGKLRRGGCPIRHVQSSFLDVLRGQCASGQWSKFPKDSEYFFTYLPYHLYSAEEFGELLHLFFDFEWLQRKVKVTSLASLISDFRFSGCASHELKLLKSSMMLSADVLDKKPDALGAQLLGRLASCVDDNPSVNELLDDVRRSCSKKRLLVPLHSCLTDPDGPLIKIFNRHDDKVLSLATTRSFSGAIVISASTDCSIKVHELETGKELKVLLGHTMAVYCLALSHGGTLLASGSYDATARIWNLDSYRELRVLEGRGGYVNALDFSTDDQRLFTGSNDGTLKVWHVSTGNLLHTIDAHEGHIRGLCSTDNGELVATASLDHTIKLWNTETLRLQGTLVGHTDTVYAVTTTDDSTILVSASGDKTLKAWDLESFQELRTLRGHQGEVYSVCVTANGERVISGGKDMVVRLWCLASGTMLFCFRGHSQSIRFVLATPDGGKALSGSQDKTFRVWDLDTNAFKQSELPGHSEDVMDIAVDHNGSVCVSSSMDGTLKIWRCQTAEERYTLRGYTKRAVSVAISPDGCHAVSLAKDCLIKVWNLELGEMVSDTEMDNEPRLVRFNHTGELVLVGCKNNQVSIWNWRNEEPRPNSVVLPAFTTMEIASDAEALYTCSRNNEICRFDLNNNNASKLCQGPNQSCTSMVILPNGGAILSGIPTESSFIYWELSSWREIRYKANHPRDALMTSIDITTDGKRALSGSSMGTISLVQLESSEIIQLYENTRTGKGIRFLALLKNGRHFAFVDETNTVELRSLDDEVQSVILGEPGSQVTSVCPIGLDLVLVGCKDGELVLFDATGFRGKHQGHIGAVTRLASSPSNDFLYFLSGGENGSVKLWYLTGLNPPTWINIWSLDKVHDHPVTALAFIPGSEDVVAGSYGNVVLRLNAVGVVRRYLFKSYGIVALRVVGVSLMAACVRGFSVVKWDLRDGRVLKKVHGGAGREQVARIHLSGHVVSKGSHHSLLYWDLNSGDIVRRLCGHTHDIRALAFVPGGAFLLSGSRDKVLKLWSLETGDLIDEFHFERYVLAIACASNGVVCVGLQGGQVCFTRVNNLI